MLSFRCRPSRPRCDSNPTDSDQLLDSWHTAGMTPTKHREAAKLDRVPLPIELGRFGVTGWQLTRTSARFLCKLTKPGSLQTKFIKESRRRSSIWARPTSNSARSSRPVRARSASRCPASSAACSTRYRPPTLMKCRSCSNGSSATSRRSCSRVSTRRPSRRRRSRRCISRRCTAAKRSSSRSSGRVSAGGSRRICRS